MTQSTQTQPEWLAWFQPAVLVALLVAIVGGTWHISAQGARLEAKVEQNAAAIAETREAIAQTREAIAETREANAAAFAELRDAIRANGVAINANAVAIGKLAGQYEEHQRHHERLVAHQTGQDS